MEKSHRLELTERAEMKLTGVTDVKEFSDSRVILKTVMGMLQIKGRKLSLGRLDTDEGTLEVSGEIDSLRYTGSAGGGVIEGLFK